jgi:hypothetical protein
MTRIALVFSALLVLGCDSPVQPITVVGSYDLARIDAKPIPATFTDTDGTILTITSGFLILREDKSWEAEVNAVAKISRADVLKSFRETGTYSVSHDTISLRDGPSGATTPALFRVNLVTATRDGRRFEFERR